MPDDARPEQMPRPAGYQRPERAVPEGLSSVLREFDVLSEQTSRRRELLRDMESLDAESAGALAFVSSEAAGIDADDIPAFGDALQSLGDVKVLNLIIDSPGGDGTVAEKIIDLCRSYCTKLRVIVPNRAKSAATIIALGADEIVMGFCSEIGPIDAQILVLVDGVPRFISAQSFIDAKTSLEKEFKECVGNSQDPRAVLQQIAALDPPFIDHCKRLMEFGKDVVRSALGRYMFRDLAPAERRRRINLVLKELSSVQRFKVHGRMIDGNVAKERLKLDVRRLGKDDTFWKLIWEYYLRAYVLLTGRLTRPSMKLVETKHLFLLKQPSMVVVPEG